MLDSSEVALPIRTLRVRAEPKPLLAANGRLGCAEQRVRILGRPSVFFARRPLLGLHPLLERRVLYLKAPPVPCDLHDGVLWDVDRWAPLAREVAIAQQVRAQHTQRCLMRHDEERLLVRVKLKNEWLQSCHNV